MDRMDRAARHRTYELGKTPAEVRKTFWNLIAQANREPVHFEGATFTGDDIRANSRTLFHVQKGAEWIAGLKNAAGSKSPGPSGTPEETDDNYASSAWSVMCADTRTWQHDPERYRRDAIRDKARYPLYGDFASGITPCAFWKPGSEQQTTIDNEVGALITQNEWDPQIPLSAGRAMHRAPRGSRMLTVAGGEGHGILYLPGGNSCADRAATACLTTGRLPDKDLTCRVSAGSG